MTTANTISTLFGKIVKFSLLKLGGQINYRFLCPNCLHFGGFDFACGECWAEIPGYANGNNTQTCPSCHLSLLSVGGDRVRAYCKRCKGNYDRAVYHQRRVRVLATLRPADSQSLYQAISGQEYQPQGGRGYVYDDGAQLAYVLNLSDFADEAHSLPQTHALWKVESIWLDVSASDPKELALEWGKAADRFIAQAGLTDAQRQAMTVYVHQAKADPMVKPVLRTRFGKVRYGVLIPGFPSERTQTKAVALEEIGYNSTVPALIAVFKDGDAGVRKETAEALVKIGEPAVPALSAGLKGSNSDVCKEAAEALVKIGKPAVPALIAALKDSDSDVCRRAAEAFVKIGKPVVPALIAALKESRAYGLVASVLIKIGEAETVVKIDKPAVPALIAAHMDSDVYGTVVSILIKIGEEQTLVGIGQSAVPALSAALKDSNSDVRRKTVQALGKIGRPAVPALIATLKDDDSYMRERAAEALGEIGDDSAVPALIAALKDINTDVRGRAAEALGKIDRPAVPALIAALKDSNSDMRGGAAKALGRTRNDSAVPALIAALKDINTDVRRQAAEALGKIGKPAVLIAALKDNDVYDSAARILARALIEVGEGETLVKISKFAVPALKAALTDSDSEISWRAAKILVKIGECSQLTVAIKSRSWSVHSEVKALLYGIAESTVPTQSAAFRNSNSDLRKEVVEALGEIGKLAVPALTAALEDSSASVRKKAADVLAKIGDNTAVPALEAADRADHRGSSCNYCAALRRLGAK